LATDGSFSVYRSKVVSSDAASAVVSIDSFGFVLFTVPHSMTTPPSVGEFKFVAVAHDKSEIDFVDTTGGGGGFVGGGFFDLDGGTPSAPGLGYIDGGEP
jgi:hypothetical protein